MARLLSIKAMSFDPDLVTSIYIENGIIKLGLETSHHMKTFCLEQHTDNQEEVEERIKYYTKLVNENRTIK
jgi:hypothetical protein